MRPRPIEANRRTPIVVVFVLYLQQATSKVPTREKDAVRGVSVRVSINRCPSKKLGRGEDEFRVNDVQVLAKRDEFLDGLSAVESG